MEKAIIELQIECEIPAGLSYAEKVQYVHDLELPTGYVEDSFGIVEFKKELDGTLCRNGYPIDDCKCC